MNLLLKATSTHDFSVNMGINFAFMHAANKGQF